MNKRFLLSIVATLFLASSFGGALTVTHAAEDKFGGLGLKVAQLFDQEAESHMGPLVILDVLDETPASKSGIQKGDIITQINGEPTKGKKFGYLIMEKLRGKIGTHADISVERAGIKEPLNFSLVRVEITFSPAQKA